MFRLKIAIAIAIAFVLSACGTTKTVPVETIKEITRTDTIYINNVQYDSIYILKELDKDYRRDLHKRPLTINTQPLVDTILIRQHDIEYRYKLLRDTIERIKLEVRHDSIPYEVHITETIEVPRKLTWYDHATRATFWLLIGFVILWLYRRFHKP